MGQSIPYMWGAEPNDKSSQPTNLLMQLALSQLKLGDLGALYAFVVVKCISCRFIICSLIRKTNKAQDPSHCLVDRQWAGYFFHLSLGSAEGSSGIGSLGCAETGILERLYIPAQCP